MNNRMKKYAVLLEIIFYMVLPYIIWTYGREDLGDYWAMLLSTVPGFIYTIFRFAKDKEFNVTGIFILSGMLIGTLVDLLSGSAERMLWNQVILSIVFCAVYLVSILIKKPLALYFSVDIAFLQGHSRVDSIALFQRKELFRWFQLITVFFILRGLTMAGLKTWLLNKYGVDAYGSMLVYMRVTGWIFGGVLFVGYIIVSNKITKVVNILKANEKKTELAEELCN